MPLTVADLVSRAPNSGNLLMNKVIGMYHRQTEESSRGNDRNLAAQTGLVGVPAGRAGGLLR